MWPTATAQDGRGGPGLAVTAEGSPNLRTAVAWPTPSEQAAPKGPLNPAWVEALMGFPPGWTAIGGPPVEASPSTNGSRPEPFAPCLTEPRD